MTRPIVSAPPIPRCPPPSDFLLGPFRQLVQKLETPKLQALVKSLAAQVKQAGSTKEGMVLRQKLAIARQELQGRQSPDDAKYRAQLRKMSDGELRGEFAKAARALWAAQRGVVYNPKQVEAAQHRLELVTAEFARRDLSIPRVSPFIGPPQLR